MGMELPGNIGREICQMGIVTYFAYMEMRIFELLEVISVLTATYMLKEFMLVKYDLGVLAFLDFLSYFELFFS